MKIIGIRKSDFPTKTGEMIKGYNVYVSDAIDPRHGPKCKIPLIPYSQLSFSDFYSKKSLPKRRLNNHD